MMNIDFYSILVIASMTICLMTIIRVHLFFWQDRYVHGKIRNYFLNIFIYVVYNKVCTIVAQRSFYFLGVFYIVSMPNESIFFDIESNQRI